MTFTFPNTAPTLTGSLITLRQLDQSVIEPYVELISDPDVAYWTGSTQSFTRDQLWDWLGSRAGAPNRLDWGVFLADSTTFAGEIVLNELNLETNSLNLRIALLPAQSSKGIGSEAVKLVCAYALGELGLSRITLDVLEENERAIRAYLRAGFRKYSEITESGRVYELMELSS